MLGLVGHLGMGDDRGRKKRRMPLGQIVRDRLGVRVGPQAPHRHGPLACTGLAVKRMPAGSAAHATRGPGGGARALTELTVEGVDQSDGRRREGQPERARLHQRRPRAVGGHRLKKQRSRRYLWRQRRLKSPASDSCRWCNHGGWMPGSPHAPWQPITTCPLSQPSDARAALTPAHRPPCQAAAACRRRWIRRSLCCQTSCCSLC